MADNGFRDRAEYVASPLTERSQVPGGISGGMRSEKRSGPHSSRSPNRELWSEGPPGGRTPVVSRSGGVWRWRDAQVSLKYADCVTGDRAEAAREAGRVLRRDELERANLRRALDGLPATYSTWETQPVLGLEYCKRSEDGLAAARTRSANLTGRLLRAGRPTQRSSAATQPALARRRGKPGEWNSGDGGGRRRALMLVDALLRARDVPLSIERAHWCIKKQPPPVARAPRRARGAHAGWPASTSRRRRARELPRLRPHQAAPRRAGRRPRQG
jgi:hypothetical protein